MASRWDESTTLRFVTEYVKHECLWNKSIPKYRNDKHGRKRAYEKLLATMNIPGFTEGAVRSKIRNIMSTYSQEKKKIKDSMAGEGPVRVPVLKWFRILHDTLQKTESVVPTVSNAVTEKETYVWNENSGGFVPVPIVKGKDKRKSEKVMNNSSCSEDENWVDSETMDSNSEIFNETSAPQREFRNENLAKLGNVEESANKSCHHQNDILLSEYRAFGNYVVQVLGNLPEDNALSALNSIMEILVKEKRKCLNQAKNDSLQNDNMFTVNYDEWIPMKKETQDDNC